ncbi:HIG1 domain-containing protein [Rickettsiales endosymbiont of Stachyamoeba lipophora]|uniref:HIG1 domain-containing protein n=1 Tax=Rickettsiales endosymbiont of Stachyamoeba lipophora TaxID=2486578 RepID=UPI000F64A874|nr:HIG1 domain-containing protein [Rickettsiales endosymbiont of Stachyamoeba lipophora]AZL15265.1 hypothetical protein EF513_01665 [Rickettsiales endosymbiont of Stachyamoeba lipophora]
MNKVTLLIFMFITIAIVIAGVLLMARGGKLNKKFSNKLMVARVIFQAIALVVAFLIFAVNK